MAEDLFQFVEVPAVRHELHSQWGRRVPVRLQRILGHAALEMTRRYVNLQTEDLQKVHRQFSALAKLTGR